MKITILKLIRLCIVIQFSILLNGCNVQFFCNKESQPDNFHGLREIYIPTIDISQDKSKQTIISNNTSIRQGHASTILIPENNTIFAIWTNKHGGPCEFLKKSEDLGDSWSKLLKIPDNWKLHSNCPSLYYLEDTNGIKRLTVFVNRGPQGLKMYRSSSLNKGLNWSPFEPVLITGKKDTLDASVMPFTSIIPIENGRKLLGFTNIRRPQEGGKTNIISQSTSLDGGITWSHWRIILDLGNPYILCEPEVIKSPDGKQLLMLLRENNRNYNSWIMLSNNEGRTWGEPFQSTASVTMDRHQACYTNDGRLIIVGRDVASNSPTKGDFVAWIGTYNDLIEGKEGQYRVRLLHSYQTAEYPSIIHLPDGSFLATNTVKYRPNGNYLVVSTKFTMHELDLMFKQQRFYLK